jgi:hypothetical protein
MATTTTRNPVDVLTAYYRNDETANVLESVAIETTLDYPTPVRTIDFKRNPIAPDIEAAYLEGFLAIFRSAGEWPDWVPPVIVAGKNKALTGALRLAAARKLRIPCKIVNVQPAIDMLTQFDPPYRWKDIVDAARLPSDLAWVLSEADYYKWADLAALDQDLQDAMYRIPYEDLIK